MGNTIDSSYRQHMQRPGTQDTHDFHTGGNADVEHDLSPRQPREYARAVAIMPYNINNLKPQ